MVESGHLAPQRPGAYDIRAFLLRGEHLRGEEVEPPSSAASSRHGEQ
jgi:hypothetical protein